MGRKAAQSKAAQPQGVDGAAPAARTPAGRPSALVDTRVIPARRDCGDCLDQLKKLPDGCVVRMHLWHRFPTRHKRVAVVTGDSNSNRNFEVFWGDLSEPRAPASGFPTRCEDRHASTAAYIDYMRPRCRMHRAEEE